MTSPMPPGSGSPRTSRRRHRADPRPLSERFGRYVRADAGASARGAAQATAGASLEALAAAWDEVAGPDRAGSIPVRRARSGVVTVACRDAGLAQKLAFRSDVLADALAAATASAVRGLRFVIADHAIPPPAATREVRPVVPGRDAAAAAQGLVAQVSDPDLRAVLERAAAVSIQRTWDAR